MRKLFFVSMFIFLFASPVFADSGIPVEVFFHPIQQCLLFVIFVLIEGFIYSKVLRLAMMVSVKFSFKANLVSTLAGFPLAILRAMVIGDFEVATYEFDKFAYYVPELLVGFVITYLIEFAVVKKTFLSFSKTDNEIKRAVLAANLITYVILGAVIFHHVAFSKPTLVNFSPSTFSVNIHEPSFYVYDGALYFNENGQLKGTGEVRVFTGPLNLNYAFVAPDGREIAIESAGKVYVLDPSRPEAILAGNFEIGQFMQRMQWSPDSKRILIKRRDVDSIWRYDSETEELTEVLPDAKSWFFLGNQGSGYLLSCVWRGG